MDSRMGILHSNPGWSGTTENFKINSEKQLQTNATEAGTAWLATTNTLLENTEWNFLIKLGFSPSANNNARVYLVSNKENLTGDLQGYFLQFGESGSDDALELFRQDGDDQTSVCRGNCRSD